MSLMLFSLFSLGCFLISVIGNYSDKSKTELENIRARYDVEMSDNRGCLSIECSCRRLCYNKLPLFDFTLQDHAVKVLLMAIWFG